MILARISKAVREQNWFAVALEFTIVIAGVAIGFQVSAWNERQQSEARVSQSLARIQLETERNIAALRHRIEINADRQRDQSLMVAVAMSGILEPEHSEAFERAVAQLMYFARPPVQQSTYEALEQSGDLALIADRDIIIALNEYRGRVAWVETQHAGFRSGLTTFTDTLEEFAYHEPTEDPTITRVRVDMDRLIADPRRQSALTQMARMHAIFGQYVVALEDHTVRLCHRLADETGQPCDDGSTP